MNISLIQQYPICDLQKSKMAVGVFLQQILSISQFLDFFIHICNLERLFGLVTMIPSSKSISFSYVLMLLFQTEMKVGMSENQGTRFVPPESER